MPLPAERTGWDGAAKAARDLIDLTDDLLRLCEELQEGEVIGARVDRQALGDIGSEVEEARLRLDRITAQANLVLQRLADKG